MTTTANIAGGIFAWLVLVFLLGVTEYAANPEPRDWVLVVAGCAAVVVVWMFAWAMCRIASDPKHNRSN